MNASSELKIENLHVSIQAVQALRGVTLRVGSGQMVGLVGRNGAGKTSLVRSIMGHLTPSQGSIHFAGHDLLALAPQDRAGLGIGYMPEDRGLVPELSVEENILLPVWVSKNLKEAPRLELVYRVLPELLEMRHRKALLLSGGQQKLAALARAMAVGTRLLLLDEPFEGVAPVLAKRLGEVIAGLKGSPVSVLIAQSDLNHARRLVDSEVEIERGATHSRARTSGPATPTPTTGPTGS
jgi:branched-chain amino acid transport system ATP-binding protein